jgi:outer membrane protein assembly factor BamB
VSLYLPTTAWVIWVAWMFYRPWSWRVRMGRLALAILGVAPFPLLLRTDGLTGQAHVNFAWRLGQKRSNEGQSLPPVGERQSDSVADLSRTTPDDFPQFLGPARTSVVAGARLRGDWNESPPREVWRQAVGAGWSSFAIVGDFALTQEEVDGTELVTCYRLADGSLVWKHADPLDRSQAASQSNLGGPGPRATPTIAGGDVYAIGRTGLLNRLDGHTGNSRWSVNVVSDNSGEQIAHGVCGSPLIANDKVVICPTGTADACLAAYDRQTGQRLWRGGRHPASYGSPALVELAGQPQIALCTADGLQSHDVETGRCLWNFAWSNNVRVNCSQPLLIDGPSGRIAFCTGYGTGSVLLEVAPAESGDWSVREIWSSPRSMKTKFTTAVIHDGHAWGLDDGILACMDLASGAQLWKAGRYSHGQVLLAGGLLIVQAEDGFVVLVRPDRQRLVEAGRIKALSGKTWNNPAISGRYLLVRNDHEAACYELPLAVAGSE